MIATALWIWGLVKTSQTARYLIVAVAIGVLIIIAHKIYSHHYRSEGYAACKVEWDASILETRKRINDAVDRARDERVPDRFDTDR